MSEIAVRSARPAPPIAHLAASPAAAGPDPRRWRVMATVVAAQFMFVVDAFVVNVAIPTIRAELHASAAEIEAVIALYLIAYATLVIVGGRLGDIHGARRVFLAGLFGFTLASLWCGLAQSGAELVVARVAQGAAAAQMVPQVLATLHVLFEGEERGRAFGVYGVVLGLGGGLGFLLGGLLVALDVGGLGWRPVFFVNVPVGLAIWLAAWRLMPRRPRRTDVRLDLAGAALLCAALVCLIAPLLAAHDLAWAPWLGAVVALGAGLAALFPRLQRRVARRGGLPLVDPALIGDRAFRRGLAATFCFFAANLSFYLVVTLFLQGALGLGPGEAGLAVLPLALAFVAASRSGAARAARRGPRALGEGCLVQLAGLAAVALVAVAVDRGHAAVMALPLALFGYGQGLVMAPLSGLVLATVGRASAGAGSGAYNTVAQIGNAAGIAVVGGLFLGVEAAASDRAALTAAFAALAVLIAACGALAARLPGPAAGAR